MPKARFGLNTNSSQLHQPRRLQQYFNADKTTFTTPHSRSLPKKKTLFKAKELGKVSGKKSAEKRRESLQTVKKSKKKERSPLSKHKASRYEHSIGKDYDSPCKDNEDLDLILSKRPTRSKGSSYIEGIIDKVYQNLTKNNFNQAIEELQAALRT